MTGTGAVPPGDFAAFIDRHRIEPKLRTWHAWRVSIGLFGAAGAMAYNLLRAPGAGTGGTVIGIALSVPFAIACLVVLAIRHRRTMADLRRHARTVHERARQVAEFVIARGNLLLLLSAIGHGLVVVGTFFKLRLFGLDGEVLLLAFLPTVLLLAHGIFEVPTRERLCRISEQTG